MEYRFDVAVSFAGENRKFAEAIAKALMNEGFEVFYDKFYQPDMWGRRPTRHIQERVWKG